MRNGNESIGIPSGIVKTPENAFSVNSFFAWPARSAGTDRLDKDHTYTTNWQNDSLGGNEPIPGTLIWSIVSVVMAFLLACIGAVSRRFALTTVYFIVFLYLGSGVIGTFHHLYWSGSPTPILALGAVFSALEVVPLTLLGFEVVHNLRVINAGGRDYAYK